MDLRRASKTEYFIIAILIIAAIASGLVVRAHTGMQSILKVDFLDIGQGDSIFITAPNGNQVLIDGGPDATVLERLDQTMPFNDRTIDLVILTHAHADHYAGLIDVMKRYDIDTVLDYQIPYEAAGYTEWNAIKHHAHNVVEAHAGQRIDIGGGAYIQVLFPYNQVTPSKQPKNAHDYMVVTRLVYGTEAVLLTGDMETEVEQKLLNAHADIASQFLKIGHHGSNTSTGIPFLQAVHPEVAFIGVGLHNKFGHPHQTTLDKLAKFGITYYRTDRDGSSELLLDGKEYAIRHF